MQPLMNMITFTARSRETIVALHTNLADALEAKDAAKTEATLIKLQSYTLELAHSVVTSRAKKAKTRQTKPV